jgi:hypothetical protein
MNRPKALSQEESRAESETAGLATTKNGRKASRRASKASESQCTKTVWDVFDEIWGQIPDEEFEKLPTDLAEQHNHYVYGLPKRTL